MMKTTYQSDHPHRITENTTDGSTNSMLNRRDFLELGGKGLAVTVGAGAAMGALVGTSGCQTVSEAFTPLNETRPVHYPRLAGHKIQSPEHYGLEGCMTALFLGQNANPDDLEETNEEVGKPASVFFLPFGMTKLVRTTYDTVLNHMDGFPKTGVIPSFTYDPRYISDRSTKKNKKIFSNIIKGDHNDVLISNARNLRKFGERNGGFFFRTCREMNLYSSWPWAGNPSGLKDAWRYIWTIFEDEGANEYATWVFNPFVGPSRSGDVVSTMEDYYPGDQYVDWVGMNAYNPDGTGGRRRSFHTLFSRGYSVIRRKHPTKPLMIAETGMNEIDYKPDWVRAAFKVVKEDFPGFKALTWWSEDWSSSTSGMDTRIDTSRAALQAFREGISDPYFLGKVPYRKVTS